ncbi:hypothetical protein BDV95DRAFT_602546 [Massariosphaeria phaeospora]|uniref:Uncharacterized protein n=1 Tax=Massariosphaeria phaeospora TaxID=100035 RepID=A0A7C8INF0_9PLEO|nr:hypothetical protein BDV95DRAFT_602546 [Massariosphaeria phaeospora]
MLDTLAPRLSSTPPSSSHGTSMGRVDSGLDASFALNAPPFMCTSSTAPTRPLLPKQTSPHDTPTTPQLVSLEPRRTASEKRHAGRRPAASRRKTAEPSSENSTLPCPRKTAESSSENSTTQTTQSRRHGRESKQSSRRTSCTFVDPSRPTRHYRIRSSQTVPTTGRDIDDVLALHFRSCSLFQSLTNHAGPPSSPICGYGKVAHADVVGPVQANSIWPTVAPPPGVDDTALVNERCRLKQSQETVDNTTTHWMSSTTRKREYEHIDRANSGLRGLLRKVVPRCVSGPPPPRFYEANTLDDDTCSVRRYRVDLSDHHNEEKSAASLRGEIPQFAKSMNLHRVKKLWGCF